MIARDPDPLEVIDWHVVHDWTLNWHWNGGPSEYPIRQCVLCNATECVLDECGGAPVHEPHEPSVSSRPVVVALTLLALLAALAGLAVAVYLVTR